MYTCAGLMSRDSQSSQSLVYQVTVADSRIGKRGPILIISLSAILFRAQQVFLVLT